MRTNHRAITDLDMIDDPDLAGDGDMVADFGAAGDAGLRGDHRVLADRDIMGDLHEIIDFSATANQGLTQSRAIDSGVGADFDIVFNHDDTDLRNLDALFAAPGIAKTIAADHHTGVQYDPVSQAAAIPHHDIGMKHAVRSDLNIRTDKSAGIERRVWADFRPRANVRMSTDRHSVSDERRGVDGRLRATRLRERERWCEQLKDFRERDIRIGNFEKRDRRSSGICRRPTLTDDHRARLAAIQIFSITRVGEKCDLTGSRFIDGCDPANSNIAIADHLTADDGRQFR